MNSTFEEETVAGRLLESVCRLPNTSAPVDEFSSTIGAVGRFWKPGERGHEHTEPMPVSAGLASALISTVNALEDRKRYRFRDTMTLYLWSGVDLDSMSIPFRDCFLGPRFLTLFSAEFSQARLEVNSYIEFSRNWDGSDGLPASQRALDESLNLLSKLERLGVVEPKTMLENDGEIGLYWRTDSCYLEIGVIGDGDWGAYGINRSTKDELMIDYYPTDERLPESLVKFLQGVNLL